MSESKKIEELENQVKKLISRLDEWDNWYDNEISCDNKIVIHWVGRRHNIHFNALKLPKEWALLKHNDLSDSNYVSYWHGPLINLNEAKNILERFFECFKQAGVVTSFTM